jgi:prolyl 4-hydroxylase
MAQSISTQEAVALAKAGNADAQYALSSVLHERGQYEESLHWLRLAAAQKLVPAQITLAILLMDGRHCPRDCQQAIELLEPLASTHSEASLLLGELYGFPEWGMTDREVGLRYLSAAARMGDAGALRQVALLSACHRRWDLARPLLEMAARRGDANAAALWKSHAASILAAAPPASIDWRSLEQALPQLATEIQLPTAEVLCEAPLIRRLPAVLPPLVLDGVINFAAPLVQRSQLIDARTGEARADPMRTSWHVTLSPRQHDHVLETIERCIIRITGLPILNSEFLQVLRYRAGEQYRLHVDYFNESGAGSQQWLADGGQRAQTVLTWLNDAYTGGSTHFPKLQLDIKGQRGDMLHFHNLGADGLGHRDTLHAGLPVIAGEKWLLSQWIRSEEYPARVAW